MYFHSNEQNRYAKENVSLAFSFSTNPTKVVLSISTGCPCLSYSAKTKWKKLDLRRLDGGCFSKCARARPTPLNTYKTEREDQIFIYINNYNILKTIKMLFYFLFQIAVQKLLYRLLFTV